MTARGEEREGGEREGARKRERERWAKVTRQGLQVGARYGRLIGPADPGRLPCLGLCVSRLGIPQDMHEDITWE